MYLFLLSFRMELTGNLFNFTCEMESYFASKKNEINVEIIIVRNTLEMCVGCRLVNRLLKHAGMDPIGYRQKVNSAFVALNNLEVFVAGAKRLTRRWKLSEKFLELH